MTKITEGRSEPRGNPRIRAEIVEMSRALHKVGAVSDEEHQKTTLRMLGNAALPKMRPLSPAQIVAVRERAGVSQAVMAGYLNVAVSTVSQWERGERRPTGAALKLLNVVKSGGIEKLQ